MMSLSSENRDHEDSIVDPDDQRERVAVQVATVDPPAIALRLVSAGRGRQERVSDVFCCDVSLSHAWSTMASLDFPPAGTDEPFYVR